jgi:hypothetical protein
MEWVRGSSWLRFVHIHPFIHPSIHTHIHPSIHPSIHTYTHTHIHTYTHTFTHTHTYAHTHMHAYIHASSSLHARARAHGLDMDCDTSLAVLLLNRLLTAMWCHQSRSLCTNESTRRVETGAACPRRRLCHSTLALSPSCLTGYK